MRNVIVFLCLFISPVAATAADSPIDVVKAFHTALETGDRNAALSRLSEEVKIFEQGHVERSREEYASHHLDSDIEFAKAVKSENKNENVKVHGDIAVITREQTTKGEFQGNPINSAGVETMVLQRSGSGWQIVHIHWSSRKLK